MGWGQIAFIIDPDILNYKSAWYNYGNCGGVRKDSIFMNDNVESVLSDVRKNYRFPFFLQQEVLFNRRISMRYVIGIVYGEENNKEIVEHYLKNMDMIIYRFMLECQKEKLHSVIKVDL
jgi:hypothetical protein